MKRSSFLKSIATILIAPSIIKDFGGINVPLAKNVIPMGELRLGAYVVVNRVKCMVTSVFIDTFTARPLRMDLDAGNGAGSEIKFNLKDV